MQTRLRRPHYWPPAAHRLDALHVRPPFDAKDGTTVMPMSAFGTKRTCQSLTAMSAFGGKADGRSSMSAFDPKRTFVKAPPEAFFLSCRREFRPVRSQSSRRKLSA